MPARCPACGEEAFTQTARFCVGCGAALPPAPPEPEPLPADAPVELLVTARPSRRPPWAHLPGSSTTTPGDVPMPVVVGLIVLLFAILLVLLLLA